MLKILAHVPGETTDEDNMQLAFYRRPNGRYLLSLCDVRDDGTYQAVELTDDFLFRLRDYLSAEIRGYNLGAKT